MEEKNGKVQTTIDKLHKVSITLFAFMQQCGIKVSISTDAKALNYTFSANDMTLTGQAYGISFILTSDDITGLDDEAIIERYCFGRTLEIGLQLLTEKATRLLQYAPEIQASRIIVPGNNGKY
jgi:hypothetical protein